MVRDRWHLHRGKQERAMGISSHEVEDQAPKSDWCQVKLVGYSWFRGRQFFGTDVPPFAKLNHTKPPKVNLIELKEWLRLLKDRLFVLFRNPLERLAAKSHAKENQVGVRLR